MPLQNRVDPMGAFVATDARGFWMGNRGGRIHDPATRTLGRRIQASRQWICCRLAFKGRRRKVWGAGYTELFFRDEATALAAGHRPCFECRRQDALAFAEAWASAKRTKRPSAPDMDATLDAERRIGRAKRLHGMQAQGLPDGVMIFDGDVPCLLKEQSLHPWRFAGHGEPRRFDRSGAYLVITPPSIVAAIAAGYKPRDL